MKVVYISYPYRDDPERRIQEVKKIVDKIVKTNPEIIPLVPHLAFIEFEQRYGREYAMRCSLEAVRRCDELWVCSEKIAEGMRKEMECAEQNGIPVVFKKFK